MGKTKQSPNDFWREYEAKTGEKVNSGGLGQYLSGWREFEKHEWTAIWGLIIATSGGFRFHHFAQQNWLTALTNLAGQDTTVEKEKTIFIPIEQIVSVQLRKESRWWKKLLGSDTPELIINYLDEYGNGRLVLEADSKSDEIASELDALIKCRIISTASSMAHNSGNQSPST